MADNKNKAHLNKLTDQDALDFHSHGTPGKIAIAPSKPLTTQRDLSLAYSPGVAAPCKVISENPDAAYDYTAKGNFVAVISNGTAVLGLGNLGALASKPVMEGKSVLFKRFADIDSVDVEVATEDPDEFINAVKYLAPSWGGINLEDIKAPECFEIEQRLKELVDIPVFHDDQHGTAVITAAGLINAAKIAGKKISDLKIVINGAGSAGIACLELIKTMGARDENCFLCDKTGVIYKGRPTGMSPVKEKHAVATDKRTLTDALDGADVFLGLSVKDAVSPEMVKNMADTPIIFAMANPDPEITPEKARAARSDAIIATGRSDYQNQVNNVMGFPYIFRGALDVRATAINEEMKIAAANALAELAREPVPAEVSAAYAGRKMSFGPDYIIPVPFDPRLIYTIPVAVAKAAIETGVARKEITDWEAYKNELAGRLNPTTNTLNLIFGKIRHNPSKVVFAEGEHKNVINAAKTWQDSSYGEAVLVTRSDKHDLLTKNLDELGIEQGELKIINITEDKIIDKYADLLYQKLQRQGYTPRDCQRMVRDERNIFSACAVEAGDADVMVTGVTRSYKSCLDDVTKIIETKQDKPLFGYSIVISKDRTVFIADTAVNELATSEEIADTAVRMAEEVRNYGHTPRVALVSFSNFGSQLRRESTRIQQAKELLDERKVDFAYDGEMSPDVALNQELLDLYPFNNLKEPANILIMPGLHSSIIATKLMQELGGSAVIGPILSGFKKPVEICSMGASVGDIINLTAIAAARSKKDGKKQAK